MHLLTQFFPTSGHGIVGGTIVALIAIGISWYYLQPYFAAKNVSNQPAPVDTSAFIVSPQEDNTEPVDTTPVSTTTTTEDVVTSTEDVFDPGSLSTEFITFPPQIRLDTSDLDADDLTDNRRRTIYDR